MDMETSSKDRVRAEKGMRCWSSKSSAAAGGIVLAVCAVSLCLGRYDIAPSEVVSCLIGRITGDTLVSETAARVVCSVRLPRILGALLCGGALAAAGAGFQAVFANPLATPDTLGVGNGASFGAVLAILTGAGTAGIRSSALFMGLAAVVLVYAFAGRAREGRILRLILAGMVVSAFFSSMTSFVKYIADPQDQLPSITYWLMGSLKNMSWGTVYSGALWIVPSVVLLVLLRWKLDALMLEEDEAASLGISVFRLRLAVIGASSVITASVVSMCGQIGWIGLLIPHVSRMIYGGSNRSVIPASLFLGGLFLLCADTAARCMTASEIPVAILTSLIGAPVFLILLGKTGGLRT